VFCHVLSSARGQETWVSYPAAQSKDRHCHAFEWTGLPQALFFWLLYWQDSKNPSPQIVKPQLMD